MHPATTAASVPLIAVQKFNPLTATMYTDKGCHEANDIFLNCCRLAAHHSPDTSLKDTMTGAPLDSDFLIFVWEPC
jgi:hypothetical protein